MTSFDLKKYAYKAIIFDCDGTLADTLPAHFSAFSQAMEEVGLTLTPEWYHARTGLSRGKLFDEYEKHHDVSLDRSRLIELSEAFFQLSIHDISEHRFTTDIARQNHGKVPMAVASAGQRANVEAILESLKILDLFQAVVTIEDVKRSKPAPDLYLLAARKLKIDPKDCLVFEDTHEGLEAAHAAGMTAIDVRPFITLKA